MVRNLLKLVLTKTMRLKVLLVQVLDLVLQVLLYGCLVVVSVVVLFGNRFGAAGAAALGAESTVEKEDKCELVNGMWQLAFNGQTARFNDRNQINAEMFGIYKSQVDADFGLYKSTRDSFDITNARVGELEKQVAVLIATRPYQDALIQSDIRRVAEHADFNLFRRTCRMITGELVLPNTPTVTGYPSYNPCRVDNSTSTPAA